jgi:hypothetical protein
MRNINPKIFLTLEIVCWRLFLNENIYKCIAAACLLASGVRILDEELKKSSLGVGVGVLDENVAPRLLPIYLFIY